MSLLYFVESDLASAGSANVVEWGLDYAIQSVTSRGARLQVGGDQIEGLLIADADSVKPSRAVVNVESQNWLPMPSVDGVRRWVGVWKDDPLEPQDLAVETQIAGYALPDAQGRHWILPAVRSPNDEGSPQSVLPREYTLDESGEPCLGDTVAKYRKLWDATEAAWGKIENGESMEEGDALRVAALLLSANYRVGLPEVALLGCFTDQGDFRPSTWVFIATGAADYLRWKEQLSEHPTEPPRGTPGEATTDGQSDLAPTTTGQLVPN